MLGPMIALLQRVLSARVDVGGDAAAQIDRGLLVFVCAERGDSVATVDRLLQRLLRYQVFPDEFGKMNRSLRDVGGALMLVPQFTLAADTSPGLRPSLGTALAPDAAAGLFEVLVDRAKARPCARGVRAVWRRHASGAGQRRSGDVLVAGRRKLRFRRARQVVRSAALPCVVACLPPEASRI